MLKTILIKKLNLKRFKKLLAFKKIILLLLIITPVLLYHNDSFYISFRDKVNNRLIRYANVDILLNINKIAHLTDLLGKIKVLKHPLKKSDFIDIKIETKEKGKLKNYLKYNPPKKKWIKIKVKVNGVFQEAKLKYHGTHSIHYSNNKYSYTIKLDKNSKGINGIKQFKLIKGEDVDPTVIAVNQIAHDLGLIAPVGKLVMLRINNKEISNYYFVEDLSEEYFKRNFDIKNYSILRNVKDWTRKENVMTNSPHHSHHDLYFGHIKNRKDSLQPYAINKYKKLCESIENENTKEIKKLIDVNYFSKFLAFQELFNDVHFSTGDNLKLIYSFNNGSFYSLYRQETFGHTLLKYAYNYEDYFLNTFPNFNKILFQSAVDSKGSVNAKLFKLLISDPQFRNKRDLHLKNLIDLSETIITNLKKKYAENEKIILHSNISRRSNYIKQEEQIKLFKTIIILAKKYLEYGHIYGSYDHINKKLYIMADAFCPLKIIYNPTNYYQSNINGIGLDINLDINYNYKEFNMDIDNFKLGKLIFINMITEDTIPNNKIYINHINESILPQSFSNKEPLKSNNIYYNLINRENVKNTN